MFERYTEKARRVIFFSRYEASNFGSPYIETEHILLGLLREDKALTNRFLCSHANVEKIRKQIEAHTTLREKILTSVDLPLSNECKRVLAYAAEEAERLGHKHVGTEHLLAGLLREDGCFAATILTERGVKLEELRQELSKFDHKVAPEPTGGSGEGHVGEPVASIARHFHDFTQEALDGTLVPVVGRDLEVDAIIEVLAGGRVHNPLLVGERGAGKRAIVQSLAHRIANGNVPPFLAEKRVIALEAQLIGISSRERVQFIGELNKALTSLAESSEIILFVGELITTAAAREPIVTQIAPGILKPDVVQGNFPCIVTCDPADYRELAQSTSWLGNAFRAVHVRPLNEDDTLAALKAHKARLESVHAVTFDDQALETAARSSSRHLADRVLPGKAFDLLDAVAAQVKLRQTGLPGEILDVLERIRFANLRLKSAIVNHEFEKARFYSDEEKKERENLRIVREKHHVDDSASSAVRGEDVEAVIERWSRYPFQP